MRRRGALILVCSLVVIAAGAAAVALRPRSPFAGGSVSCMYVDRPPRIRPDYTDTVIPPNIAPLNFVVEEPGSYYRVEVSSSAIDNEPIVVESRSPKIIIPPKAWRELLQLSRGGKLLWDVSVCGAGGKVTCFDTITNTIAPEDIDGYLVYRLIRPLYNYWWDVGIYQRDLSNYRQSAVLDGKAASHICVNCHTFCGPRTDRLTVGLRSEAHGDGTLIADGDVIAKTDSKFGYTSWHPSGKLVAYSLSKVRQFFHAAGGEVRDVVDLDSDLVYYEIGSDRVKTAAAISDPNRLETYPTWSPDGRYLYFCSAPFLWSNRSIMPPEHYDEVRYDLVRVPYDIATDHWGKAEAVLSARETGKSIMLPRVSPDGRYLLFCLCDYGCFPIYQPSSDLYLMDLATRQYERLDVNSDRSESWHSWSSNGRWFAFSSKRRDGLFTRSYFSYFDANGKAHKPFLMPQKDPTFYDSFLKTYSVPELVSAPVRRSSRELEAAARGRSQVTLKMPATSMSPKGEASSPWRPFPGGAAGAPQEPGPWAPGRE